MEKSDLKNLIKQGCIYPIKKDLSANFLAEMPDGYLCFFILYFDQKIYYPSKEIASKAFEIYTYMHKEMCINPMYMYQMNVDFQLQNTYPSQQGKLDLLKEVLAKENNLLNHFLEETHLSHIQKMVVFSRWFNSFNENHLDFIYWLKNSYIGNEENFVPPFNELINTLLDLNYVINDRAAGIFKGLLQVEKIKYLQEKITEFQTRGDANITNNTIQRTKEVKYKMLEEVFIQKENFTASISALRELSIIDLNNKRLISPGLFKGAIKEWIDIVRTERKFINYVNDFDLTLLLNNFFIDLNLSTKTNGKTLRNPLTKAAKKRYRAHLLVKIRE